MSGVKLIKKQNKNIDKSDIKCNLNSTLSCIYTYIQRRRERGEGAIPPTTNIYIFETLYFLK